MHNLADAVHPHACIYRCTASQCMCLQMHGISLHITASHCISLHVSTDAMQTPLHQALRMILCPIPPQHRACILRVILTHTTSQSRFKSSLPSTLHCCVCRPTEEGRNACCIAIGTDHLGVLLLSLTFHQHGLKGVKSQGVRLLPHTASVLSMCVAWDYTPPVCPFPASTTCADAAMPHQGSASGSAPGEGAMVQDAPAGEQASAQHFATLQCTLDLRSKQSEDFLATIHLAFTVSPIPCDIRQQRPGESKYSAWST